METDEIGMSIAEEVAKNSEDQNTKVGSCILSKYNVLLSTGYNGVPDNWKGKFPWERDIKRLGKKNTKYPYVIHSECNTIMSYEGDKKELEGATLYVTLFPCNECSKLIVQSGIKRVVYKEDKYKDTEDNILSKILLSSCGVEYIQYDELKKEDKEKVKTKELI